MPLYYIAIIIGLYVYGFGSRYYLGSHNGISILNIVFHFFFLHGLSPYYVNSIIGVEWYIGVLFILYLISPFIYNKIKSLENAVFLFGVSTFLCEIIQRVVYILMPTGCRHFKGCWKIRVQFHLLNYTQILQ